MPFFSISEASLFNILLALDRFTQKYIHLGSPVASGWYRGVGRFYLFEEEHSCVNNT